MERGNAPVFYFVQRATVCLVSSEVRMARMTDSTCRTSSGVMEVMGVPASMWPMKSSSSR